jgi:hypothetical protein
MRTIGRIAGTAGGALSFVDLAGVATGAVTIPQAPTNIEDNDLGFEMSYLEQCQPDFFCTTDSSMQSGL